MPEHTVLDLPTLQELKDAAGGDFVLELLGTFSEEAPLLLAELRQAVMAADATVFRRAAHSLKTNAQTFGALALAAQAKALELGGMPADGVPLQQLQAACDEALAALQEACRG